MEFLLISLLALGLIGLGAFLLKRPHGWSASVAERQPGAASAQTASVEEQIDQWRTYVRRRPTIKNAEVAELEDHLRAQMVVLADAGLTADEAFLVAAKRTGDLDALAREFGVAHSAHFWKLPDVVTGGNAGSADRRRSEALVAFVVAVAAAVCLKIPQFFGLELEQDADFYFRNVSLFVLPWLTGYFAWKRQLPSRTLGWLVGAFVAMAVLINSYPFALEGATMALAGLHLPIALWLVVGIAYAGGRWNQVAARMDFIRFSGELFIYFVLIALGGGVFTGFLLLMFETIGINAGWFIQSWLLPCGAAGALIVAAWLVEAKESVIENIAPMLTRLFTPLFTMLLVTFLGTLLWSGRGVAIERDMLIAFDLLLVLVLALLLYAISARDPRSAPGAFDVLQVVLVISALLADAVALGAIAARITEFGFSPNRVAVLGVNVLLLINLAWSAVLYLQFLRGRGAFASLERWQTTYLPVYVAWATIVVVVFPPLFRFI